MTTKEIIESLSPYFSNGLELKHAMVEFRKDKPLLNYVEAGKLLLKELQNAN